MKNKIVLLTFCLLLSACLPQALQPAAQAEEGATVENIEVTEDATSGMGAESADGILATATVETAPAFTPALITPQNVSQLQQIREFQLPSPASRLVWSLDGSMIGAMTSDSLYRFSIPDLTLLGSVQVEAPFILLDFSPDGTTMAATSDWATIHLLSAIDGSLIRTIAPPQPFTSAFFSPDGRTLVINSTEELAANLWDVQSGQFIQSFTGFETAAPVYTVFYSSNGRYIIWMSRAHLQLTGINSGQIGTAFFHEDFVVATALNPEGSILAASTDGMVGDALVPFVKLWDPVSGEDLGNLQNPTMAQSLAFSPDGSLLAAGQWIWDIQARTSLFDIGDPVGISDCKFSPDGFTLSAINNEGKLTLWQAAAP